PLISRRADCELVVIVNTLAPALNTIPLTSVLAEVEMPVTLEEAKLAVSDGPLGTVAGVQLAAVFQSPLVGLEVQVALPAWLACMLQSKRRADRSVVLKAKLMRRASAPEWDVVVCVFIGLFYLLGGAT